MYFRLSVSKIWDWGDSMSQLSINRGERHIKDYLTKKKKIVNAVLKTDPFADATMPANQNNETEIKPQTERAHRY